MKTTDIKQIIAKDPNAIFVIKQRFGRGTSYGSITEVIEREVPVYDNYRQTGTRIEFVFAVSHHTYSRGYLRSDGDYSDQVPAYGLATRKVSAREIQSHMAHWEATTIQEWVAQQDAEVKAYHQEKIERAGAKQQLINRILNDFGIVLSVGDEATDKRWDHLNNELDRLSIDTLKMLVHNYTPSRV
jgi:hypothetical protein